MFFLTGGIPRVGGGAIIAAGLSSDELSKRLDEDPFIVHGVATPEVVDPDRGHPWCAVEPSVNAQSRISVTIDLGSNPIAGSIAQPGRAELEFYGWLELLVILEALHSGDACRGKPRSQIDTSY